MVNILDLLKGQLGSAAIGQIAELIGEDNSKTSSAINSILPSLLGGLMQKGTSTEGASGLLDMLSKNNLDGSMFSNLTGMLGGGSKTSAMMNIGSIALPFIMGGKKAGFMNLLSKVTGLGGTSSSSLTNLLLPMVLGMVGKQVKKGGLSATGLIDMLKGQKEPVMNQLPKEMGDFLGLSKSPQPVKSVATRATAATSKATSETVKTVKEEKASGGLLKWLVPLALILGAGWLFTKGCGGEVANTVDNNVNTAIETTTQAVEGNKENTTYIVDGVGNLVDNSGTVIKEAGEFTQDASGNIMDASGNAIESISSKTTEIVSEGKEALETVTTEGGEKLKSMRLIMDDSGNLTNEAGEVLYKKGEFKEVNGYYVDSAGKRLGRVWDKIKKAVGDAAEKTADFFKGSFGKMFKKDAGASSTYTLSTMTFDTESHRLTNYSKAEFEGLVAALKANPDSKISVQVHTSDGKDDKENKKLTKMRADQIELMIETLGVGKKQVSSKGMGSADATKAGANAIEIVVE